MRLLKVAASLSLPLVTGLCFGQAVAGNWQQTWGDDFNVGSSDLNGWTYDLGNNNGWGNNELETYTNSTQNVNVSGGNLNITAYNTGSGYTSGRIQTDQVFSQTDGLFEFRAKLPAGQGLWPALWMYPETSAYGGWPTSGEIDVAESTGQSSTLVQGSLHSGPSAGQDDTQTQTFAGSGLEPSGFSTQNWNTYDLEWTAGTNGQPGKIQWFVNGTLYETQQGGWYTPPGAGPDAPFDQPFFIVLDLAVGGTYGGTPSLAQNTPYSMEIDYINAYEAAPAPEPASVVALGTGGLVLLLRKRARKSQRQNR